MEKMYAVVVGGEPTNIVGEAVVQKLLQDEEQMRWYTQGADGNLSSLDEDGSAVEVVGFSVGKPRQYAILRANGDVANTTIVYGTFRDKPVIKTGDSFRFGGDDAAIGIPVGLYGRKLPTIFIPILSTLGIGARHLYLKEESVLEYLVRDGQPLIRYRKSEMKAGKLLRKLLPSYITDKVVQECARILDSKNPAVAREAEVMNPTILAGLGAADQTRHSLGSCMYKHSYWQTLDSYFDLKGATLDDLRREPAPDASPLTLIWNPTSREVHQGCEQVRAFVWPVTHNGERKWYVDRVYPASNHTRDWAAEFCSNIGIELFNGYFHSNGGSGIYGERAMAQPPMAVKLHRPLYVPSAEAGLPWLDTFLRLSSDGHHLFTTQMEGKLTSSGCGTHSTSGNWGGHGVVHCCDCGKHITSSRDLHTKAGGGAKCKKCATEKPATIERDHPQVLESFVDEIELAYGA